MPPDLQERAERAAHDIEVVEQALREEGLDDNGASPHGWRCENPDRYPGYCTCVHDAAVAIVRALARAHGSPEANPD